MKEWRVKFNLFAPVFYVVMIVLIATGEVSPWVALLIILSDVEFDITLGG